MACPPIVSPCFYGIDMSTVSELFAPQFLQGGPMTPTKSKPRWRPAWGPIRSAICRWRPIARAIGFPAADLCQACITGDYPTPCGQELARIAVENDRNNIAGRTYETVGEARQLFLKPAR